MSSAPKIPASAAREFVLGDPVVADAGALADIMSRSFAESWTLDAFRTEIERRSTRMRVARPLLPSSEVGVRAARTPPSNEVESSVVGYVLGWRVLDEVQILSLAVDPAWRGCGVARRLLDDYLARLRKEEVRRVMLEVRESNKPGLSLYTSEGFAVEGVRTRYYKDGENALLLGVTVR